VKCRSLALIPLAASLLGAPAPPGNLTADGEPLTPGPPRERSIAAGEKHSYRVEVTDAPLLVTVEQRGIDLVIEGQRPGEPGKTFTDALNGRWGPEALLLPAEAAGGYRIEVHPGQRFVPVGRYAIQVEELSSASEEGEQRAAALAAMSRAGQLAGGDPEAQGRALAQYREALAVWRALGDRRWEAEALQEIAELESQSGDLRSAVQSYLGSTAIWRDLAEPSREAAALTGLGTIRLKTGETEAAREPLEQSSALWRSLDERFEEAMARGELCHLSHLRGDLTAALACYEEVRELFRAAGDSSQESRILNNLGGIYDLLGDPDAALDHYRQALPLWRALGHHRGEADTLKNIAMIHQALGEWQEALRVHDQTREILASSGDPWQDDTLLNNVGFTYLGLGEPQRALSFLEKALQLRQRTGARRDELITLNNLGDAWRRLGNPNRALEYQRQALELAGALKDPWQEAMSRLRLAETQLDLGHPAVALQEIEPALASIREKGLVRLELQLLQLQGRALALAGRPKEALPVIQGALSRRQSLDDRSGEAETLRTLASVERSLGFREPARAHAEAAVAQVEELRNGFVSPDLRVAFLAARCRAYSLLIDLLMDGRAADPGGRLVREAFEVSERARARSLLDALFTGRPQRAGSGVPAELLARRQRLRRRLSVMAFRQAQQNGADKSKVDALEHDVEKIFAELDGVEGEIRRRDPDATAVSQPPPVGVEGIARLLDPGTLLLEYSLGEERSYLWAISSEGLRSFELPPEREIEDLARRVYDELSTVELGSDRRNDPVEALSRILLRPVWSEVTRARRLAVVPDGALQAVPFAALRVPAPGKSWDVPGSFAPLLESLEVVDLPSATTLALQRQRLARRPPATQWAAVLADPVFAADDPRLARPSVASRQPQVAATKVPARSPATRGLLPAFERLPSSEREAKGIAGLAPAGQVKIALGLAATRESVLAGDFRAYRVLHFATHGVADTRDPELSGLVLSLVDSAGKPREGFLGLSDIYELDLDADLVVLSGCWTAFGKEVRGEGLMGLTRGFLYAGVPRVVASLWKVEDRTTAELMDHFYRGMWGQGLSPAAALREAQRSLRHQPRYRDPYSWAGFVLQGDWRSPNPVR
jgi:CHAT domain-containing protein/tetratricopeptide (TPR) repeat protein